MMGPVQAMRAERFKRIASWETCPRFKNTHQKLGIELILRLINTQLQGNCICETPRFWNEDQVLVLGCREGILY